MDVIIGLVLAGGGNLDLAFSSNIADWLYCLIMLQPKLVIFDIDLFCV